MTAPRFHVVGRDGAARTGRLELAHGTVQTPAFMPVATYGAVRGVSADDLRGLGAEMLLANTFHLHERPGEELIASLGGLHGFTGWSGPWLTDSGGFQITSLADRVRLDDDGVTFASPVDGRSRRLTPESTVEIQAALGSDIAMVLDECRPVAPEEAQDAAQQAAVAAAVERSLRWAERARRAHDKPEQALFGIVQGGVDLDLRRHSARATAEIGFDGHAHGGLGLGEAPERRLEAIEAAHEVLPSEAPRYLMGIGRPEDVVQAIGHGVDLFDCVVPTRHGRHGVLYTSSGIVMIKNARFASDPDPIDVDCDCPTCTHHSRAYLRHLYRSGESLGARLGSLHNLRFYLRLMARAREAIACGSFHALGAQVVAAGGVRVE